MQQVNLVKLCSVVSAIQGTSLSYNLIIAFSFGAVSEQAKITELLRDEGTCHPVQRYDSLTCF